MNNSGETPLHFAARKGKNDCVQILLNSGAKVKLFFDIHYENGSIPGGLHLEMTPDIVSECIDFESVYIKNIKDNYKSKCDPRLNGHQSISLVTSLCDYILKNN